MSIDFLLSDNTDLQYSSNGDLTSTNTIETAILTALFFEKRDNNQKGHYSFSNENNDGSKLWKLKQSKITQKTLNEVRRYGEEALNFLVIENLVDSLVVSTSLKDNKIILLINIEKNGLTIEREYDI